MVCVWHSFFFRWEGWEGGDGRGGEGGRRLQRLPARAGIVITSVASIPYMVNYRPYTVNFKCTFKYFSKIELPRSLAWKCAGLLSECSVAAIGNRSGDGSRV